MSRHDTLMFTDRRCIMTTRFNHRSPGRLVAGVAMLMLVLALLLASGGHAVALAMPKLVLSAGA
jgi:hypothetical protein